MILSHIVWRTIKGVRYKCRNAAPFPWWSHHHILSYPPPKWPGSWMDHHSCGSSAMGPLSHQVCLWKFVTPEKQVPNLNHCLHFLRATFTLQDKERRKMTYTWITSIYRIILWEKYLLPVLVHKRSQNCRISPKIWYISLCNTIYIYKYLT